MELKLLLLTSLFYLDVLGYHECGVSYIQEVPKPYIINKQHQIGTWPWVVSMHLDGRQICTGFIISPRYVLTAAHCYMTLMLNDDNKHHQFSIHAGTVHANEGEVVPVKKVTTYDDYISYDIENDIALLELERPLKFSENISSVCLPRYFQEFPDGNAFLAGFGHTFDEETGYSKNNEMLNDVVINFQKFDYCKRSSELWNHNITNYICGGAQMKGSAAGDSGGPLMVKEKVYQNGGLKSRWFAVGVISGGDHPKAEDIDAPWSHTLSTRISFYCDWIKKTTSGEAICYEISSQSTPTNSQNPNCFDKEKRAGVCKTYKDKKICVNRQHKQNYYARVNCAKTCGICKIR